MRLIALFIVCISLSACGGGDAASDTSKNAVAARACDVFAKNSLDPKTYSLDLEALGRSMKPDGDMQALTGSILIEPGLSGETKSTLDCKVRFNADSSKADVISLNFIY